MPERLAAVTEPLAGTAGDRDRVRVLGAPVTAITEAEAVRSIIEDATARRGSWTITANLDHLRRYRREPLARALIDRADLVLADGTPLLWASRLAGTRLPERVAGSNIIWSLSEEASRRRASVFLLGGAPGVADRAADVLAKRYVGLAVAGTLCPPLGFEKDRQQLDSMERQIARAAPDVVFVALGFPKQDLLIRDLRHLLPYASFVGVGISLSFVAGELTRAPGWAHGLGLEWLYRLGQEPRRLMKRYLFQGLPFAALLILHALCHRVGRAPDGALWGRASREAAPAKSRGQRGAVAYGKPDEPSASDPSVGFAVSAIPAPPVRPPIAGQI